MKLSRIPLLGRIVIAIILGVLFGQIVPFWLARIFSNFNDLFGNFLSFLIPLIIIGLVTPAIGELGKGAGRFLVITTIIAYISTLFSGFFTYFSCQWTFPAILDGMSLPAAGSDTLNSVPTTYFSINMPPLLDVMSALIFSFCVGIGLSLIKGNALQKVFVDFRDIIIRIIASVIIPLLPIYIFGMVMSMTVSGQVYSIIMLFMKVIVVVFILHILILLILFSIAGIVSGRNPLKLLRTMLPAYATALGTSSSAATIPVTLNCTLKNRVTEPIASFTIPLCATIHLPGSTLKIVAFSIAFLYFSGMPVDLATFVEFIFLIGIAMIAAPGVPGGAIMAAIGIIQSILGFNEELIAMMITAYLAVDSFGTACNVTGDGAIAVIMDKIAGNKTKKSENTQSQTILY